MLLLYNPSDYIVSDNASLMGSDVSRTFCISDDVGAVSLLNNFDLVVIGIRSFPIVFPVLLVKWDL